MLSRHAALEAGATQGSRDLLEPLALLLFLDEPRINLIFRHSVILQLRILLVFGSQCLIFLSDAQVVRCSKATGA